MTAAPAQQGTIADAMRMIRAGEMHSSEFEMRRSGGRVSLSREGEGEANNNARGVRGTAFTGEPVLRWWGWMALDLEGGELPDREVTLQWEHGWDFSDLAKESLHIVGKVSAELGPQGVDVVGGSFASTPLADFLLARMDEGMLLEFSIGPDVYEWEELQPGKTITLNNREVTGPMLIGRKWRVREISLVRNGADPYTDVEALRRASGTNQSITSHSLSSQKGHHMTATDPSTAEGGTKLSATIVGETVDEQVEDLVENHAELYEGVAAKVKADMADEEEEEEGDGAGSGDGSGGAAMSKGASATEFLDAGVDAETAIRFADEGLSLEGGKRLWASMSKKIDTEAALSVSRERAAGHNGETQGAGLSAGASGVLAGLSDRAKEAMQKEANLAGKSLEEYLTQTVARD